MIFVGAGDLGKEVLGWMVSSGSPLARDKELCFIDDNVSHLSLASLELRYLGVIDSVSPDDGDKFIVSISSPKSRSLIVDKLLSRSCSIASYIHPSVNISLGATIGEGCILLPYALVSCDSTLGSYSILNCYSSLGHDVAVGNFVTISSHVDITGHCVIGDKVFMGSGARVLPGKSVGHSAVIGAGATAVRSVPAGRTLYAPLAKLL